MANNPIIIDRNWKAAINTDPKYPFCSLLSLWDAFFYWDKDYPASEEGREPGSWKTRFQIVFEEAGAYRHVGLPLAHTTIKLDEDMYKKGPDGHRVLDQDFVPFEKFALNGFDISLPMYDMRVKPLYLTPANVTKYITPTTTVTAQMIKEELEGLIAIFKPYTDATDYYAPQGAGLKIWPKNSILIPANTYEEYIKSPFKTSVPSLGSKNTWTDYSTPPTVGVENDGLDGVVNSNIVLTQKDFQFINKYLQNSPNLTAWDGMCLNYSIDSTWQILYRYFGNETGTKDVFLPTISNGAIDYSSMPVTKFVLENTFFFVKNAFFADYIDFRDFNQKLNGDADVKHKNLTISIAGDSDRFDKAYQKDDEGYVEKRDDAKYTRPWIPAATPTVDKLTKGLVSSFEFYPDGSIKRTLTIQKIIDESLNPSSPIGSLWNEPFEMSHKDFTFEAQEANPPMYFDPSSRKTANDYDDIPIVVPKDGNLVVDGRITSPTIDELWSAIKQLAAGRASDTIDPQDPSDDLYAGGYPRGVQDEEIIDKDSRLTMKHFKFKTALGRDGISKGDPIDITYEWKVDSTKKPASYQVQNWVNDPESINYKYTKELSEFNDALCEATSTSPKAWKYAYNSLDFLENVVQYAVNTTVLSNRELEALLKGLKYNFSYLIKILQRDYAFAGSLGRNNEDPRNLESNKNAGSIYALHKDSYGVEGDENGKPPHNTVYDNRFNDPTFVSGTRGVGLGKMTLDKFPINDVNKEIPSWATYMAADGEYHSTGQVCLIPCVKELW